MTKLSERMPDTNYVAGMGEWLKALAEYIEFIDRRDRLAYRDLREQLAQPTQKTEIKYEPQTYDEAIGFLKGWPRAAFGYDISWEKDKWPELWKEMVKANCRRHLCYELDEWTFKLLSTTQRDATPGRVVCQAYLVYRGHADWAERLSKND